MIETFLKQFNIFSDAIYHNLKKQGIFESINEENTKIWELQANFAPYKNQNLENFNQQKKIKIESKTVSEDNTMIPPMNLEKKNTFHNNEVEKKMEKKNDEDSKEDQLSFIEMSSEEKKKNTLLKEHEFFVEDRIKKLEEKNEDLQYENKKLISDNQDLLQKIMVQQSSLERLHMKIENLHYENKNLINNNLDLQQNNKKLYFYLHNDESTEEINKKSIMELIESQEINTKLEVEDLLGSELVTKNQQEIKMRNFSPMKEYYQQIHRAREVLESEYVKYSEVEEKILGYIQMWEDHFQKKDQKEIEKTKRVRMKTVQEFDKKPPEDPSEESPE